jgi:predicted alpha-1,2-mannosidase
MGFSHTHLSGTGVGDYGDIRFMPVTGDNSWEPGPPENPDEGYRSRFRHETEVASPGYYAVLLDDYNIKCELTVTERTGYHRYTFPEDGEASILIDLVESITSDRILDAGLMFLSDREVAGMRRTDGWSDDQHVYFHAVFSEPFKTSSVWSSGKVMAEASAFSGDSLKALLSFGKGLTKPIEVKVGISAVSMEGARKNLEAENKGWKFQKVMKNARKTWESELSKVKVEDPDGDAKTVFYTALYHAFIAPNLYSDVDGSYRGHDGEIHRLEEGRMYTVFSLWDTYRAAHPLFTILQPERNVEFINSMLDIYDKSGLLPVWELAANETNCMIGYHSVPVIVDAYMKGLRGFDTEKGLQAMIASAESRLFGLDAYIKYGYIPADEEGESVSRTLEYAYDDWCIAQMAKALGNEDVYKRFIRRAQSYKNLFDPGTGFIRGKMNGMFTNPFDPAEVNFMLTEANTWQYNFYVPHDITGLINLYGNERLFEKKLDEMFNAPPDLTGRQQADITGLIGQYAHGNEPSHHMAYLYNFVGKPSKTQEIVQMIMRDLYTTGPAGLCGNEDCGQMSAWYVLSALGFYPVTPGTDDYIIGFPIFQKAEIFFRDKTFEISVKGEQDTESYIQNATLNGEPYPYSYLKHGELTGGGKLEFQMGPDPDDEWGKSLEYRPVTEIRDEMITPVPYLSSGNKTFKRSTLIWMDHVYDTAEIFYSYRSRFPSASTGLRFSDSIRLTSTAQIFARAFREGRSPSKAVEANFYRLEHDYRISYKYPYSSQYTAGGDMALVDRISGGENFRTGAWQGFQGTDMEVLIDLGELVPVSRITATFLEDQNAWIFMPRRVTIEVSKRPYDFKTVAILSNDLPERTYEPVVKEFSKGNLRLRGRYIKIKAENIGTCPPWHKGAGGKAWIFADEIEIN